MLTLRGASETFLGYLQLDEQAANSPQVIKKHEGSVPELTENVSFLTTYIKDDTLSPEEIRKKRRDAAQPSTPIERRQLARRITTEKRKDYCVTQYETKLRRLMLTIGAYSIDRTFTHLLFNTDLPEWDSLVYALTFQADRMIEKDAPLQAALLAKQNYDECVFQEATLSALIALLAAERIDLQTENTNFRYSPLRSNRAEEGIKQRRLRTQLEIVATTIFEGIKADLSPREFSALWKRYDFWLGGKLYNLHNPKQYEAFFQRLHEVIVIKLVSNALPNAKDLPDSATWQNWEDAVDAKFNELHQKLEIVQRQLANAKKGMEQFGLNFQFKDEEIFRFRQLLPDFSGLDLTKTQKHDIYVTWRADINQQNENGETLLHLAMQYQAPDKTAEEQIVIRRNLIRQLVVGNEHYDFNLCNNAGQTVLMVAAPDGRTLLHYLYELGERDLMLELMLRYVDFNITSAPIDGHPIMTVTNKVGTPLLNQLIAEDKKGAVQLLLGKKVPINDRAPPVTKHDTLNFR